MTRRKAVQIAGTQAGALQPKGPGVLEKYRPAQRVRLADQLYEQVLQGIVSGEYAEGTRLPSENQLSDAFGVSRPIVREALFRLQVDGLVVARQGSGTYVQRRPSAEFFQHAPAGAVAEVLRFFELRIAVEGEAAFHAAQRRTESDLNRINASNKRLEAVITAGEVGVSEDIDLHEAIAQAAHNDLFLETLRHLTTLFDASLRLTRGLSLKKQASRQRLVQDEHAAIVFAISEGNPDSARTAMRHHIDNARIRLVSGNQEP
ncbi:MAG: FadR family transcriptional regulator [Devosia sp.]|uniref:FadR/GntR family transcriptional regulator n=1 Tax=Devosia sp. 66-22 TaxID=1895753 RepID=UPI000A8D84E7|nr:FadR/GntR family transcriptional regulator [Devosia sp. 66-22]MBN9348510.1 FadR family transcriptional regulator [Devosia sp.]